MANLMQVRHARRVAKAKGVRVIWAKGNVMRFYFPDGRRIHVWYPFPDGRCNDQDEKDLGEIIREIESLPRLEWPKGKTRFKMPGKVLRWRKRGQR